MNIRRTFQSFTLCALALVSTLPAFSQTATVTEPSVTAIEVRGNKSISTNTILSKLKTRVGSPYQESVVSDDLKRLYQLGFFSDVKIDTEPYEGGSRLIITVEERPLIEKISFKGNRAIKEETLKKSIDSKENSYVSHPDLVEDVTVLEKLYEQKGFGQVDVTYALDVDEETNKAKVVFSIREGKRQKIRAIYVEGNISFPDRRILKVIKSRKAWLFNPGTLKEEVLEEDIERVKGFYHNNGFIDASADYELKTDPSGRFIYVTIKIEEGKQYFVGTLKARGNKDFTEEQILARVKESVPGKVFSQEALKRDIASIQGMYFDNGYISADLQASTSLNSFTQRVDIIFNVIENEISYVNQVKVRGNVKTRDKVVRRELRIKPGNRFDGEKLRRSKERLQNLGFFEEVSFDIEDTSVSNKKDLVVEVKETKTGMFSFGGGYSTVDQFVGFVEIEQKNFDWKNFPYFTGAGQDLKLRSSFGSFSQSYELSFTDPWIFDYPLSFGFDLYQRNHERERDIGYGYDEEVTGGDIRLGKEISEYVRGTFMYRYDTIDISNISDDASADLKAEAGENAISSTEYGLTYDSRDNVFNPTKGDVLSGSMQVAGGPFGGDKDFWKFFGRVSHFFPLFNLSSLELRQRVGLADSYGDTDRIPIYERFFAGGAYSIRGYRERKIGPLDPLTGDPLGGEALLIGNIEYTYPLLSFLRVAAFYDIGNIWATASDIGTSSLKSGTGIGFRLKTPIGPIMLDYGIPLNKEPDQDKRDSGRFHFSMSHGF